MSTSKHTPGPWSVSKDGDDYNITYNTDGNWLATVYDDDDPVAGRPESDASLIAAAPELLEALRRAERFITNGLELGYIRVPSMPNPVVGDTLGIILAAIAKAEGRG